MTFETLDFLAEAQRIKAAFDLKGDCAFRRLDDMTMSLWQNGSFGVELNRQNGLQFYCFYLKDEERTYGIRSLDMSTIIIATSIAIRWDNRVRFQVVHEESDFVYGPILAKGLFYLGLLSPEAETELRVNISDHQKLEWKSEYQRRMESSNGL